MALVWKLLTLIAVLLMPFAMTAAPAAAVSHQSASLPMQHCPEQPPKQSGKAGLAECTMACSAALPASETRHDEVVLTGSVPVESQAVNELYGLHPDTATPPPKLT